MRKLKFHEQKLLKKVNFLEWKETNTTREQLVTSKYLLKGRDDYKKYNLVVGMIKKLSETLSRLKDTDPTKIAISRKLITLLYDSGLIENKKLLDCTKVTVSSFCERRLPMIIARKKMVESFIRADEFVQHGHIRIGTKLVNDTSRIVSRSMEDFVTWTDSSKIRKKINEFNDEQDDYGFV
ncbi:Small subunit (SSU) processome component [Glugoides intestinalis]